MVSQSQTKEEGRENTSLISHSSDNLINHRLHSNYQSVDSSTYEWNVEIDVKGQVNTGGSDTTNHRFSFNKLLQYTGPGKKRKKINKYLFTSSEHFFFNIRLVNVSVAISPTYF
jgi:hypothetical protein